MGNLKALKSFFYSENGSIQYRPGTSDEAIIKAVLVDRVEYQLPKFQPNTILDIGANIGVTSVLYALAYPKARIFAFEPVKENFQLLKENTKPFPNVTCLNYALGSEERELVIRKSDDENNYGGFSFFQPGSREGHATVTMKNASAALVFLGVRHVDFIKIDTEGAEHEILTAIDPKILKEVIWIDGELHGEKDFELFQYLSADFKLGFQKHFAARNYHFQGFNLAALQRKETNGNA